MTTRTLTGPPSILPLYVRVAAPMIPGASLLPFFPGGGGEVPELELELTEVHADTDALAAYAKVCDFALRDHLPPTYPHVLAFPLQMAVMADGSFPFGAVGLVHLENRIVQRRPIGVEEELTLRVRPTNLEPHPKGKTFSLVTETRIDTETPWESESTFLRRGKTDPDAATGSASDAVVPTAKPLGFPGAIAHGMWTKARSLAALESRLPDAFAVDVRFRKPIVLPARVEFAASAEGEEIAFAVRDAKRGAPHLEGLVRPTEPAMATTERNQ